MELLINLWLEHEGREFHHTVANRLQRLVGCALPANTGFYPQRASPSPPGCSVATARLPGLAEDGLLDPLDLEMPGPSEPLPRRKRHSRRWRSSLQSVLSAAGFWDCRAASCGLVRTLGLFVLGLTGDINNYGYFASPVTEITETAFSGATLSSNHCFLSAPFKAGVILTRTVNFKTENSKNCFSSAGSTHGTNFIQTVFVEPAPLPVSVPAPLSPQTPL